MYEMVNYKYVVIVARAAVPPGTVVLGGRTYESTATEMDFRRCNEEEAVERLLLEVLRRYFNTL